ncbi:MAG TPA: hypothetical protein PKM69_08175, partial [Bacteroidales bacterium]|nr:hypothetical protein [Bacteroidales bacterium]
KSLQLDKEEGEYDDEIAEKNKAISEIQNRLLELSFDTSEASNAEKLKLEEDLSEKQKDSLFLSRDRHVQLLYRQSQLQSLHL